MRAIVFDGDLHLQQRPDPQPAQGEVRIRTLVAGICNTDLEIVQGYLGFRGVLGHEFVGVVDRPSESPWLGRRVVGEINASCGQCSHCRAGRPTHCPSRSTLGIHRRDGALAEFLCLPVGCLHPVPPGLPDEWAVFAEPLAAACEILAQVHIRPTDRVLVLGDGKLGLLVAQVLSLVGADLTLVGRHPAKLAIASARGIGTALSGSEPGGGADVVVECTGHPDGFRLARSLVRARGILVLKSTYHGNVEIDLSSLVVDEVLLVGSRCGPFAAALRLLDSGRVDVSQLITAEYSLDRAADAFAHASSPGALKILVRP